MAATAAASSAPRGKEPPSFQRRDKLREIQRESQKKWADDKTFEVDAPAEGVAQEKFFVTFPYPYMNGRLHLGHAFSLSKAEFAASYQRLRGKKTLFPFGFHCTGMPIRACADKLKMEMALYGNPPVFPVEEAPKEAEEEPEPEAAAAAADPKKRKKSSKQILKTGGKKYQWDIMKQMGLPQELIPEFADPKQWLTYFPPFAKEDVTELGCKVDWRRSFITTDINPYYDSFIRWQFNHLRRLDKIDFGKRPCIYSPKDGQPCMDHDRATGEEAKPQQYTLIKMQVIPPFAGKLAALEGKNVFLGAATLRPETMYGQTNCWAKPEMKYGAYQVNDTDVIICTGRAARNMAFQALSPKFGEVVQVLELTGQDLMGLPLKAPLTSCPIIYTLPMLSIKEGKGTGIVTSVPSDAPDDYQALMDLKNKPKLREKYGIRDEWVLPFEVIPIINIPEYGNRAAEVVCQRLGIQSQNDTDKLAQAKDEVYLKGFYAGVLEVGEYAGRTVNDAKELIRSKMIETGEACNYYEPDKEVISRSGDDCVVCLADQWYLKYGEPEWRKLAERNVEALECYHEMTKDKFRQTLNWLREWACSRSYGLGTRIPWDENYLIESLSDSTIYMAYYTVAHLLQEHALDGSKGGPAGITAAQMTPQVWDYIFMNTPYPAESGVAEDVLARLRREFNFWYPLDLRVSGKDLVPNHLTFAVYNHTALFPEDKWIRAIRGNGFLNVNGDKMSKSTGNFLSMRDATERYSSDATRFALADAGDSLEDGNFSEETANKAILRLTTFLEWTREMLAAQAGARSAATTDSHAYWDSLFETQINKKIAETRHHYDRMEFREAVRTGFYELQTARDLYRDAVGETNMKGSLVMRYIEVQTLLLTPITPHICEHIWGLLGKGSVMNARFPEDGPVDEGLLLQAEYIVELAHSLRLKLERQATKGPKPTTGYLYVANRYPAWQEALINLLSETYSENEPRFPNDKELVARANDLEAIKSNKDAKKKAIPYLMAVKAQCMTEGRKALSLGLPFNEFDFLTVHADYLKATVGLPGGITIFRSDAEGIPNPKDVASTAVPGKPAALFFVPEASA